MNDFLRGALAASVMTLSAAGAAHAVSFGVVGVSSSNTTATVDFSYDGIDTLTVDIMNTASVSPDPRVTGFAFNAPTGVAGISGFAPTGTQGNANWFEIYAPDGVNTPGGNNGMFDFGATTANNAPNNTNSGINGGSPNFGVAANDTGSFSLTLTGDATFLAGLTADSFLSLSSSDGNNAFPFAVRFQRLDDNGVTSDIAFGGPTVVPLPAALPLFLTALAGLSFAARRRRAA